MAAEIKSKSIENYQVTISARGHEWLSDEPQTKGGDDTGPSPYELLLSSLAACKIITAQMYARRKDWPVESITISIGFRKIDAADCEGCRSEPGTKIDLIEGEIQFEGDLTPDQISRLHEISNRCPVQRSLTSETVVRFDKQPDLVEL